jgi:N-acetylglucosaminyldiphosphoundecaprenol N-acetyl-beta-D-mannosaminyltransferase
LLLPDGIGVVTASRLLRLGRMERVPGCEFALALCERAARRGHGIFLFGGSPDVNVGAERALRRRYPGIRIVGRRHGYVSEAEMPGVIQQINASGAEILFVALGSPKQELWIDAHAPQLRVKICQGVGGTFDVMAGRVRRAPRMFRAANLEWFYRLMSQPTRLVRQTALPRFAAQVLLTAGASFVGRPARPVMRVASSPPSPRRT